MEKFYKNSLSEAEYITLVTSTIDAYKDGIGGNVDNVGMVGHNPIKAEQMFNRVLLSICIEDYDSNNYNDYFKKGVHIKLRKEVINAQEAWLLVQSIIKDSKDISVVINNFLGDLLDFIDTRLPNIESMKSLFGNFGEIINDYQSIVNPTKEEFDKKLENGDYSHIKKK